MRGALTLSFAGAVLSGAFAAAFELPDACTKTANQTFVSPADALACYKSFPFNTTLRDNVISAVSRVFDFYTFEDYYYHVPSPFQESTLNIRGELSRMRKTKYDSDYSFNSDLLNMTLRLNDGHAQWFPNCYLAFESLLPTPVAILEIDGKEGVYVVPELNKFVSLLGPAYISYLADLGFDWRRLEGAEVLEIEGQSAYDYIDYIAHTQTGNYLDHGVRVSSVVSSYLISDGAFIQRFGDLAGSLILEKPGLTLKVILANATKPESIFVPYVTEYIGTANYTDSASFWAGNCAATPDTNGADWYPDDAQTKRALTAKPHRTAHVVDKHYASAVDLSSLNQPSLLTTFGLSGVIASAILTGNTTGVLYVGSFRPSEDDYIQFQIDVDTAVLAMKAAGVTNILIDLTNNRGGFVCLGQFLHQYFAGSDFGYPGFEGTLRANTFAKEILAAQIARGEGAQYFPSNGFAFLNDTAYPDDYNYFEPTLPVVVNGRADPTSQRMHDVCTPFNISIPGQPVWNISISAQPPFDLRNVAIISNGICASTCAQFSTVMHERHHVKMATFGGKPREPMEYKGMAGLESLEFADLKSEIKTARLNNSTLAPPDLLVNGNMRLNWRTAWSYFNESSPIAFVSERAHYRFPYTDKTYSDPQALWAFAAKQLLN